MNNFIKTSDKDTAEQLKKQGFNLISQEGNIFVFLNDKPTKFSEEYNKKLVYTNIINM